MNSVASRTPPWLAIAAGIVVVQALALHFMGQPWICTCGTIRFWEGDVSGRRAPSS
ncbi:MAG: hypothetical protein R3D25_17865 [Geminicoccaceae bacterium]